jgi:hypothetical protein
MESKTRNVNLQLKQPLRLAANNVGHMQLWQYMLLQPGLYWLLGQGTHTLSDAKDCTDGVLDCDVPAKEAVTM